MSKSTPQQIQQEIKARIKEYQQIRDGFTCYPLLARRAMILPNLVDDVYMELTSG
jgi:hypothetical protein